MEAKKPQVILHPKEGPAVAVAGDVYTMKAGGEATGGQYALFEFTAGPGGGPPPHIHSREDEAFYVIEGELTFFTQGRAVRLGPGGFVHLVRGIAHTFKNEGSTPAGALVWAIPAGLDKFFFEVGRPVTDKSALPPPPSPAEIEKLVVTAPKYGLEILPPGTPI